MGDLEQLLRDYGRSADEVVRPVSMDDLGSRPVSLAAVPPERFARVWRGPGFVTVAACVVLAVGLGFVLGRMSAPEMVEVPPAESPQRVPSVPDGLVTLPEPAPTVPSDPVDEVMETSIGSISWTRVEGDREALPHRVVDRDGSTLIGDSDWDPTVRWVSTDGGESWQRSETDGVRGEAGGHEWSNRVRVDGQFRLSRVTADGEIDVAVDPAIVDVPDGWSLSTLHSDPIDIGGEAFVLTRSSVRADLGGVTPEGVTALTLTHDSGGMTRYFNDVGGRIMPENELQLVVATEPDSKMVDLVDPAGEVVATFDAGIGTLDEVDPATLVMYGGGTSQWTVFDGDGFAAVDVPWATSGYATVVSVGDSVMVVSSPQWGLTTESQGASVWTTTDGRTWVDITPGDPDEPPTFLTELTETDDAVIVGNAESWFITSDGQSFESLSTRPMTGQRYRSDVGWVAMARGAYTLWVSPDGDDWESHRITGLHEIGYAGSSASGTINVIDSTIYIVVESGLNDDRAVLLIGEITPTP